MFCFDLKCIFFHHFPPRPWKFRRGALSSLPSVWYPVGGCAAPSMYTTFLPLFILMLSLLISLSSSQQKNYMNSSVKHTNVYKNFCDFVSQTKIGIFLNVNYIITLFIKSSNNKLLFDVMLFCYSFLSK